MPLTHVSVFVPILCCFCYCSFVVLSKVWENCASCFVLYFGRAVVQETGIKTIPMEKKGKNAKWLSGEALQIAVKRREAKSKGEKERYKHLNAEFQRTARGDKKAFLNDQCKEIKENNRMGKTRDLQENERYQRNISCKDRHNKGQKWYGPNRSRRY